MAQAIETAINNYAMNEGSRELVASCDITLLSSIFGGGKNTVLDALLQVGGFRKIISHTTRQPRRNHGVMEVDGVDYHFVDTAMAELMVADNAFVEVKKVHDNIYGTSVEALHYASSDGNTALAEINVEGVVEYLAVNPDTHAIFLLPPSVETWEARLQQRYGGPLSDHADDLMTRYRSARGEIETVMADPRFVLVVNDDLDTTIRRVRDVVAGKYEESSDYALAIAEHLMGYIATKLATAP